MSISHLYLLLASLVFAGLSQPAQAGKSDMATIGEQGFRQKDFVDKKVKRKYRMGIALAKFRPTAERELIKLRLPECQIDADEESIMTFISWWRVELEAAHSRLQDDTEVAFNSFEKIIARLKENLEHLTPEDKKARSVATTEIQQWLQFKCIQDQYQGDRFYELDANGAMKMKEREDAVLLFSSVNKGGMTFPGDYRSPEPAAALEIFFLESEADGQLSFKDSEYRDLFFARYKADSHYKSLAAEETTLSTSTPYWLPAQ